MKQLMLWSLMASLLSNGCSSLSDCEDHAPPPPIQFCVVNEAGSDMAQGEVIKLQGAVQEIGAGSLPALCKERGSFKSWGNTPTEEVWWFKIKAGDGQIWTFVFAVPGSSHLLAVGKEVTVSLMSNHACFMGSISTIELRDEKEVLFFWVGQSDQAAQLSLPTELGTVRPGDPICKQHDQCGEWQEYDLLLTSNGKDTVIPYGQQITIDQRFFIHGGYLDAIDFFGECHDWCKGNARLAAFSVK